MYAYVVKHIAAVWTFEISSNIL